MYIAIVTDALEDGGPLVITDDKTGMPRVFAKIADIEDLKEDDVLVACDWWAFNCETGKTTLLDA
jgi:hypothetical protein